MMFRYFRIDLLDILSTVESVVKLARKMDCQAEVVSNNEKNYERMNQTRRKVIFVSPSFFILKYPVVHLRDVIERDTRID